VRRIGLPR